MQVSQSYSSFPMSKSPTMEYLEQTHPPPKASVVNTPPPTKKKHKHSVQNDHTSLDPHPQASSNNNAATSADEEAEEGLNNLNNNQKKEQDAFLSSFPPGYRFNPRDEELVQYYLRRKIIDEPLPPNKIMQVNLYRHNPETLAERYEAYGEKEWYFFTPRDRKYRNGHRPNRAAGDGYWKATGADRPIFSNGVKGQPIIGYRKALVFYRGKPPKGDKTNWIMHEYRVDGSRPITRRNENDMRLDNWVLCRIYKKIGKTNHKSQIQNLKEDYTDELVHAAPENNEEEMMNEEEVMNDQDDKTQVSVISNVYPHIIVHPSMESQTEYANYGYHYSGGQPVCSMVVRDQVQTVSFNPDNSYTHGQMQFACGSSSAMNYQDRKFAPESMIYSKEKGKWTMQYPDQKHFDPCSQERGEKSDDADDHIWQQPIPSFQDNQVSQYMDDSSVDDHNLMFAYPSPFVSLDNWFSSGNILL